MSAMTFNAGVILLCSLPLCQFTQTAFGQYASTTANQCMSFMIRTGALMLISNECSSHLLYSHIWSADVQSDCHFLGIRLFHIFYAWNVCFDLFLPDLQSLQEAGRESTQL